MSIYVDELRPCVPNERWKWEQSCHLFTAPGALDKLHSFARKLGLKREWFQDDDIIPHYDLTASKREIAVRKGAVEVDSEKLVEFIEKWRNWKKENSLPVISIRQPWPWLITQGIKDIENRTWRTNFRGPILIHASKRVDLKSYRELTMDRGLDLPPIGELKTGGIVGIADVIDCVTSHHSPWFTGPFGLVLSNAKMLPFVQLSGKLRIFHIRETNSYLDCFCFSCKTVFRPDLHSEPYRCGCDSPVNRKWCEVCPYENRSGEQ